MPSYSINATHVLGIDLNGVLWHSIVKYQPQFGEVSKAAGPLPGKLVDVASAVDDNEDLQVVVVTEQGGLFHTIRHKKDTSWDHWGNVKDVSGNPGKIVKVYANSAGDSAVSYVCLTDAKEVFFTSRDSNGRWLKFERVKNPEGTTPGFVEVACGLQLHS